MSSRFSTTEIKLALEYRYNVYPVGQFRPHFPSLAYPFFFKLITNSPWTIVPSGDIKVLWTISDEEEAGFPPRECKMQNFISFLTALKIKKVSNFFLRKISSFIKNVPSRDNCPWQVRSELCPRGVKYSYEQKDVNYNIYYSVLCTVWKCMNYLT